MMGGEDFGRFQLADKSIESLIFWVGGVPHAKWAAAGGDPLKLPSLHSPVGHQTLSRQSRPPRMR
ncbi:hypothetical protein E0504_43710 [Parafrankia sp. BMG5.11]|nr:hypothetical protein E0504_43710 [Parafrankia sp. BMG5.11]